MQLMSYFVLPTDRSPDSSVYQKWSHAVDSKKVRRYGATGVGSLACLQTVYYFLVNAAEQLLTGALFVTIETRMVQPEMV